MTLTVHPEASQGDAEGLPWIVEIRRVLTQRRWFLLGTVATAVVIAIGYSLVATPEYRAVTSIKIERQVPELLSFVEGGGPDPAGYREFYQTEYSILESRAVMERTLDTLELLRRPEYTARRQGLAERLRGRLREWSGGTPRDPRERALDFLERGASILPVRNSHLVRVAFTDRDPALAGEISIAIAEAYEEFQAETRSSLSGRARDFLRRDVARVEREISELERELQDYSEQKGLVALDTEHRDVSVAALGDLNRRRVEARAAHGEALSRLRALQVAEDATLAEASGSELIVRLRQTVADLERRHAELAGAFKDDWPPLVAIGDELSMTSAQLERETRRAAEATRQAAAQRVTEAAGELTAIEREFEAIERQVQRVSGDTIEYQRLLRQIEAKRGALAELVARQSETETEFHLGETRATNVRIVDRAIPPRKPIRPRVLVNLLLALAIGTIGGIGVAFVVDQLDNSIKSEDDASRWSGLPVVGAIPDAPPAAGPVAAVTRLDLISHHEARSAVAECFRNLRTSMLLAMPSEPPRVILVSSSEPGEGKSTVSTNLAVVLSQMGRRVLLVDADLRRPRLEKAFALEGASVGLSSVLTGNASIDEAIHETEVPGLSVLPSGPLPPNPSELLAGGELPRHLAAATEFDHIVLDSPPVLAVADSQILATYADATIIVTRAGRTAREILRRCAERFSRTRAHVVGVVLNAFTESSGSYYYRRYGTYGSENAVATEAAATPDPTAARRRAG